MTPEEAWGDSDSAAIDKEALTRWRSWRRSLRTENLREVNGDSLHQRIVRELVASNTYMQTRFFKRTTLVARALIYGDRNGWAPRSELDSARYLECLMGEYDEPWPIPDAYSVWAEPGYTRVDVYEVTVSTDVFKDKVERYCDLWFRLDCEHESDLHLWRVDRFGEKREIPAGAKEWYCGVAQ